MKKIITAAVLLGIAGVAASPYLIGSKIASVVQDQAGFVNQYLARTVKASPYLKGGSFTLESYEKSYAEATAKSLLKLETIFPGENGEPLVLEIPVTSEVKHGPYLGESGFGLAKVTSRPDIAAMDLPEFIKADTFTVEDIIGFSGQLNEITTVEPITYDDGDVTFELSGFKADIETSLTNRLSFTGDIAVAGMKASGSHGDGAFHLKPFKITTQGKGDQATLSGDYQFESSVISGESDNGMKLSIEKLSAKGAYKTSETTDLPLGEQELLLTNVKMTNPETFPEPVTVPEFRGKGLIKEGAQGTFDIAADYSATLSPGLMAAFQSPVDVKTVDINFALKSLPAEVLQAYTELMQNFSDPEQPSVDVTAMQEKLPALIRMIVSSGMAGVIKVKAETEEGKLDAGVDVNFIANGDFSDDDAMELMANAGEDPTALLDYLEGKGSLHLDKSVTDKAGMTPMVQMMGADFVRLEGEAFRSELLIKDGDILVNGQVLPVFSEGGMGDSVPLLPEDGSGSMPSEEDLKSMLPDDLSEAEKAALKSLMESMEAEAAAE